MKKIISVVGALGISLLIISCGGGGGSPGTDSGNGTGASTGTETYTFDLTNRVAKAYPEKCTNSMVAFEMKFLKDGLQFVRGTDSTDEGPNGSCIAKETKPSEVGVMNTYAEAKDSGFLIPCGGPVCTFAQLNGTYKGVDADKRVWTQVVSHLKNSNQIKSTKTWTEGQTQKVSSIRLEFVENDYWIDLTAQTGAVYALKCLPPKIAFKLRFTAVGLGFTEGTDSVTVNNDGTCTQNPTREDEKGVIAPYAAVKSDGFIIPCGNAICTGYELNLTYKGTDGDGRVWAQKVSHVKGSKEIFSTKTWIDSNGITKEAASKLVLD